MDQAKIVDPGPFQLGAFITKPGDVTRFDVVVRTWSKTDHVGAPPGPGEETRDDVAFISKMILFDDDGHFSQDIKTQRRFAPMLSTIDRNHCPRSLEYAAGINMRRGLPTCMPGHSVCDRPGNDRGYYRNSHHGSM
jgi:hypothetical protein